MSFALFSYFQSTGQRYEVGVHIILFFQERAEAQRG